MSINAYHAFVLHIYLGQNAGIGYRNKSIYETPYCSLLPFGAVLFYVISPCSTKASDQATMNSRRSSII